MDFVGSIGCIFIIAPQYPTDQGLGEEIRGQESLELEKMTFCQITKLFLHQYSSHASMPPNPMHHIPCTTVFKTVMQLPLMLPYQPIMPSL